jgi:hypothetical protein
MVGMRGLFYRFSAAAFVFGATVGAVDQSIFKDQFNPVVIDSEIDGRVHAYIKIVPKTDRLLSERYIAAKDLRDCAAEWTEGFEKRTLLPVLPGYHGENMADGPKGQILRTQLNLAKRMHALAVQDGKSGNSIQAIRDELASLTLMRNVRNSINYQVEVIESFMSPSLEHLMVQLQKVKALPLELKSKIVELNTIDSVPSEVLKEMNRIRLQYLARYGTDKIDGDSDWSMKYGIGSNAQRFHLVETELSKAVLACRFVDEN